MRAREKRAAAKTSGADVLSSSKKLRKTSEAGSNPLPLVRPRVKLRNTNCTNGEICQQLEILKFVFKKINHCIVFPINMACIFFFQTVFSVSFK